VLQVLLLLVAKFAATEKQAHIARQCAAPLSPSFWP
jgi:hypothetical protein